MNTSVNKYSKSQPKAGKYLLKKGSKMTAVSNYVPALRTMQQDKTAANPNLPKTNQHKENCYKLDGYKSNHYRKHCSRFIQSVRKFLLTTNADNCFKLLSKFPDCTLQVLTLFVAQYPPRCYYCIVRCIDFVQFRVKQRVHYKLVMKTYEVSLLHVIEPWKPAIVFSQCFFSKKNPSSKIDQKSLLQAAISIFLDLTALQNSTATICFCTTSQGTIKS